VKHEIIHAPIGSPAFTVRFASAGKTQAASWFHSHQEIALNRMCLSASPTVSNPGDLLSRWLNMAVQMDRPQLFRRQVLWQSTLEGYFQKTCPRRISAVECRGIP
jgi:hypothetical protein